MRKLSFIIITLLAAISASAQTITFSSDAFEDGVKAHIGLDETASVTQSQTDTITAIDLSRLGIDDLRDVAYLPAVQKLNLSCNHVSDLSPLLSLQSLKDLNLSNNGLENIDVLAFTSVSEMIVDVSFNYISDFSFFFTPMACSFTFIGMDQQTEKDAPYLNVCEFYAQISEEGLPMITYRGYTNNSEPTLLKCLEAQTEAIVDGQTYIVDVPGSPETVAEITISTGELGDTTYVVPTADYTVEAGKSLTLETGLPDDYQLSSAYAMLGTVEINGNSLLYTAPEKLMPDTVYISYYQGATLRGFSRFYINKDAIETIETVPIKIGSNGKTTYTGDKDLDFSFSDEVKAFIATGFDKTEGIIWMTRVKDVPAGVPVMIKGTADETYNVPVAESSASYYKNMFKGNISGETVVINATEENEELGTLQNYYMSKGQFVSVNGTAKIGNNKCYLQLPANFEAEAQGADQSVKIASTGKSSFAAPVDLDFTNLGDDLKAFTATGYDANTKTVWLTRVKKVQKGEGLMLKGTGGETYTIPSSGVQASYVNMIVGNTSGDGIEIGEKSDDGLLTNYYLKGGTYMSVSVSANIGNNKSYLQLPTSMLAGARSEEATDMQSEYSFAELETEPMPLILAETTGIESMDNGKWIMDNEAGAQWYSLDGRRVSQPTKKGLYIRDGKKVVIK